MDPLKLTEELASDIKARVKSLDFRTIDKLRKAKEENGSFDVIISTEDIDRSGEIVRQDGWEMANYKNNPIVLWGHDYYSLPIGVCTETYKTEVHGVPATGARGVFYPADINPLAQQVRRMYEYGIKTGLGVGCTTSVGFIPKEFDTSGDKPVITKAELLEFSFVPIPANQGVGPAAGRALTFDEAKELGLDVAELRVKGLEFVEAEKAADTEEKEAQAGDSCTMDDGDPGILGDDGNGTLVCQPVQEKAAEDGKPLQKKLLKAVADEHDRHTGEMEKAFDEFREKSQVVEDQGDPADANETEKAQKAAKASEGMREAVKDLRSAVADEHTMHRAKSIANFRGFDSADDKAFDKKPHLKALRDAHDDYESKCMKSLDEFETKLTKSVQGEPGTSDEHTDWITGKMEEAQRVHKKAVTKIAKAMCKDAFGEEDQADEKTLEILKEFLTPHINASLLPAVIGKIGAKLS